MFESSKTIPELADLPAAERKRAWRGGFRHALNRLPFLLMALCLVAVVGGLGSVAMESFANKWAQLGVFMTSVLIINAVLSRMLIHYARPYWQQLRQREG